MSEPAGRGSRVINAPVDRWFAPVRRYLHVEAASGIALLACTILALVAANSPLAGWFASLWHAHVNLTVGRFVLTGDLGHLVVNDGLMALFFFVVGLEIKRELVKGELRDRRKALLPVLAAVGGMVVPAAIYLALQRGTPGQRGFAIPMATDIAFVVGVVALFGPRIPFGLKIFLLTLAIVDDLGAVVVIALGYSGALSWGWIAAAIAGFLAAAGLGRIGVRKFGPYIVVGVFAWFATLQSGIHPTVAGVFLGLLTPARARLGETRFAAAVGDLGERLRGRDLSDAEARSDLAQLELVAREAVSPLARLERILHPWVAFGIMPLFALTNAGVVFGSSRILDPVAIAVVAGLVIGKPAGILFFSALSVATGATRLPDGVTWPMVAGAACLAGIGFTMALFLNSLAFPVEEFPQLEMAGKLGIMAGSLISLLLGAALLALAIRARARRDDAQPAA
jgi:NhaA family Na+:H+ antiporter